jgi:hypothetical protein
MPPLTLPLAFVLLGADRFLRGQFVCVLSFPFFLAQHVVCVCLLVLLVRLFNRLPADQPGEPAE